MHSQKQTILDAVCRSHDHPTAEQIVQRAREMKPSLAVGTVYRNLARLTDTGELRRIDIPGSPTRYDGNLSPHEHMVCLRCGELQDVELGVDVLDYLRKSTGQEILTYQLNLGCICPNCREAENGSPEKARAGKSPEKTAP